MSLLKYCQGLLTPVIRRHHEGYGHVNDISFQEQYVKTSFVCQSVGQDQGLTRKAMSEFNLKKTKQEIKKQIVPQESVGLI